jgi:oligoribonuclease
LEYYRRTLFVPLPGPDVDAAKAIAAELSREGDTDAS